MWSKFEFCKAARTRLMVMRQTWLGLETGYLLILLKTVVSHSSIVGSFKQDWFLHSFSISSCPCVCANLLYCVSWITADQILLLCLFTIDNLVFWLEKNYQTYRSFQWYKIKTIFTSNWSGPKVSFISYDWFMLWQGKHYLHALQFPTSQMA